MTEDRNAAGYRTDIRYTTHYQPELHPGRQAMALTAHGRRAPDPNGTFTHLELGCGFGLTALFHAATHPRAHFIAVDVSPEHIGWASGVAEAAALDNVRFIRAPFAELAARDVPPCDVIALHGVWSWVDDANRQHLLQTIAARLKPDGLLYVSYNALPGLAQIAPLRDLLRTAYQRTAGDVPDRIAGAFDVAQRLQGVGARFFGVNPAAAAYIAELPKAPLEYLAHEFFNADWRSFYFAQVAADMAAIDLKFAGSADVIDLLDSVTLSQDCRGLLACEPDPSHREMLRDYVINRDFRADFFTRTLATTVAHARDTVCAITIGAGDFERVALRTARGTFKPGLVPHRIMNRLQRGHASAATLFAEPAFADFGIEPLTDAMTMLVAMGAADPVLDAAGFAERRARTDRLNHALWTQALVSDDVSVSASPLTGSAVHTSRLEQLFLTALARSEDPVIFALPLFGDEARDQITAAAAAFMIERLPVLRRLGIA